MKDKDYILTKQMFENIERLSKKPLRESEEDKESSIAITNDPRFGQNVLQNQIEAFRKSVSGGAKFADENNDDAESNPLVFYPKSGNLVFTGSIPNLSGLRFQFSLNDVTNAPYIFVDGLALTEDVLMILQRLSGTYKNWVEEWQASTDLLDKLKKEENKKPRFN
jgi:hypothetical protein